MKALILYASREGQTEKVATRIAGHLTQSGLVVHLVNAADSAATDRIDLEAYDLLVFGASMHAGGLERELVHFVDANAERVSAQARSFFLVLLSAATEDPVLRGESLADARGKMNDQLSVVFDDTEMIAGALRYSKYSLPLKWLMRRIARQAGEGTDISRDYEYTDWQQVESYAARLASFGTG
jgi:menaquinone-dependent protoporphyrinogen oxidase